MNLIQAKIPSSGESLPRLGLGSYRNFDCEPESAAGQGVAKVLKHFAAQGGRLVDSSPMYGKSEACLGTLSTELGLNTGLFVATKVWTQGADSGREQMLASLEKLGRNKIELMQVHNLSDFKTMWPTLKEWKAAGKFRYIGVTHYQTAAFSELEALLRSVPMDFLQIPYSIAERAAERGLIPLAADKGVALIANEPFDQGGLFKAVKGRTLPDWAIELGIQNWAQFFLKYIFADPRVQFAIPATARLEHLIDFMPGGAGVLPDEAQRRRMLAEFSGELRRTADS